MAFLQAVRHRVARILGAEGGVGLDEFGGLVTSEFLPKYARLAAAGKLYAVDMHAGTAIAPVTAAPTTSPQWGLYNPSTTESLIVIQAAVTLKSGTAGLGLTMMMAAARGPQTAVSADYAGTIKSCTNGSQQQPDFFLTSNPTLVGGTPAWSVLRATAVNTVATDSVGDGLVADNLEGIFIAKPNGGMVAMEVVGETGASALFTVSFIVAMLLLDLSTI